MDAIQKTRELSEAALRLEAIIKTATDGIIVINERGIIEQANEAAARLFGYAAEELLGENVNILVPSPHHQQHDTYIANYLRTGKAKIIGIGREVEGLRKDGHRFPIRLSISEVKLSDRHIFTGIVHDLTQQKEAEKALKREKERAQRYLDVANNIFVVLDREGNIDLLNRKGCELLGYPEEKVTGKNWFDLVIQPEHREQVRQNFQRLIEEAEAGNDYYENEIITKKGDRRLIAWRNALIRNEKGETVATISSGVDITEQRAAEEHIKNLNAELEQRVEMRTEELAEAVNQLLNINKQLEYEIQERRAAELALRKSEQELRKAYEKEKELSELKSRFVSMASHEFRTPLSTILSSADIIEEYRSGEQQSRREKHTARIKSAVANLTGILNDFLSLSRLEEGLIEQTPVSFELNSFIDLVVDELQGLLKPGQEIRRKGTDGETFVFLDRKFLKNVLFNLLSNAIKYSGPTKPIDLITEVKADRIFVTIIDRGIGIPEEEQQHLFTRFFRARNVENIQGTGLGLNIVKRYIELMKGSITFESKLGEGTTFHFSLPLKKEDG